MLYLAFDDAGSVTFWTGLIWAKNASDLSGTIAFVASFSFTSVNTAAHLILGKVQFAASWASPC